MHILNFSSSMVKIALYVEYVSPEVIPFNKGFRTKEIVAKTVS